jgi:hypothetical protein
MSDPKDLVLAAGRRSMTLFKETFIVLGRPLFEDMSVARRINYNRDDAGWLVGRSFEHRKRWGLTRFEMSACLAFGTGPLLTSDVGTEGRLGSGPSPRP